MSDKDFKKWVASEIERLSKHAAAKASTPEQIAAYCRGKRSALVSVLRILEGRSTL